MVLGCTLLHAQEYVIGLKHWDVKDGLPHRQVTSTYQDRAGFIWAATPQGLSRFDGYKFVTYYAVRNPAFDDIQQVAEDANGNLWLVSRAKKHDCIFNPLTGKVIPMSDVLGNIKGTIWDMFILADSSLVCRTVENQFYVWHPKKGLTTWKIPGGYTLIGCDPQTKSFYIANSNNDLSKADIRGKIVKTVNAPPVPSSVVYEADEHGIYIVTKERAVLYYISPDLEIKNVSGVFPPRLSDPNPIATINNGAAVFYDYKIFIPGTGVLRDFREEKIPGFDERISLIPGSKDRTWISTGYGLYQLTLRKNQFRQYYNGKKGIGAINACRGIIEWNGKLYVSNEFGGLFCIDKATGKSKLLDQGYYYPAKKISGGIMAGDECIVDGKGKVTKFKKPASMIGDCWCVYEYAKGKCILGYNPGLRWFNENTLAFAPYTQYNDFEELSASLVLCITPDRNGQVWMCTNTGLYAMDAAKGITARYSAADTGSHYLPATQFQHFIQDANGIYWLATESGLIRWDRANKISKLYTQADGLSNNNIYAVYDDDYGNVWMSSDYGIMKMNKATGVVKTYTEDDGITNNEFNRVSHYKDDSGLIYFGSLNGITVIDPRNFLADTSDKKSRSNLAITSFLQFNGETNKLEDKRASLVAGNTITLNPQDRFFTLEFALLNFDNPQQTNYYWKIDGIDTGWNVQKDRTLRFSRLPYDTHVLHIKAQAADGVWSKNELVININVTRPFYLNLWFLFAVVIAAVVMVIAGYRWRVYRLRRENKRLDKVVQERTGDLKKKTDDLEVSLAQKDVLLKEVHHRVKNNLQVISSLLQMQSRGIDDEKARRALLEGRNRIMAIAAIHQRLYQEDALEALELGTFAGDIFNQIAGIYTIDEKQFILENNIHEMNVEIDQAVLLGLILNELFTNSFKYAFTNVSDPRIILQSGKEGEKYSLVYRDNGPGLKEGIGIGDLPSMGMRLITGLTEQLNGDVSYYYDKGFCMKFSFTPDEKKKTVY